jgi:hypothetical protein
MDNRVQTSEGELPVLATATVETETGGTELGRLRRPVKRREDYEADRRKRREDGEDVEDAEDGEGEEQSLSGAADDEASEEQAAEDEAVEEADASDEENESPDRELDVKL